MSDKRLAEKIIELSLGWTGADEDDVPALKTIRTLAGYETQTRRACRTCRWYDAEYQNHGLCQGIVWYDTENNDPWHGCRIAVEPTALDDSGLDFKVHVKPDFSCDDWEERK